MPVGWRRLANLELEYTNYVNCFAQIMVTLQKFCQVSQTVFLVPFILLNGKSKLQLQSPELVLLAMASKIFIWSINQHEGRSGN